MIAFSDLPSHLLGLAQDKPAFLTLNRFDSFNVIFKEWYDFVLENSPEHSMVSTKVTKRGKTFQTAIRFGPSNKPLTHKQVEVMELLIEGLSCKQIAKLNGMSPDTVRGHLKEAYVRLSAKTRAQAVSNYLQARASVGLYPAEVQDD